MGTCYFSWILIFYSAVDKYTADSINIFPRDVNNNPLYVLNQNDDLNNCLIPGTYICSSNLIAETLQNTPYTAGNFKLFVIQNTGISNTGKWLSQTLFSTSGYLYHRGYDKDAYTNWKCLTDDYSNISLQTNGYIVFTNGLILQWGQKSFPQRTETQWALPLTASIRNVQLTTGPTGQYNPAKLLWGNASSSNITIYQDSTYNGSLNVGIFIISTGV